MGDAGGGAIAVQRGVVASHDAPCAWSGLQGFLPVSEFIGISEKVHDEFETDFVVDMVGVGILFLDLA